MKYYAKLVFDGSTLYRCWHSKKTGFLGLTIFIFIRFSQDYLFGCCEIVNITKYGRGYGLRKHKNFLVCFKKVFCLNTQNIWRLTFISILVFFAETSQAMMRSCDFILHVVPLALPANNQLSLSPESLQQ